MKKRIPLTHIIPNDHNYLFYHQNLKNLSHLSQELNYDGITPRNDYIEVSNNKQTKSSGSTTKNIDNYKDEKVIPLNFQYVNKKKIDFNQESRNILNDKFINPERGYDYKRYNNFTNYKQKPLKWKCQRQWEETEGPNFIDPQYIYPGSIKN